ncbi:IS701 family transposase [Streptomyces sp. NBC_01304]|uniref:IS701 family transposase n=1 Tax=Streptomyces sp. NBC_01304 TaxID=2903818 RepID=UPI002E14A112|nr:transposase [Streptomyces sp. NBC_01304]
MSVPTETKMPGEAVSEFLSETLRSIPRSDQRRWGELYVRALMEAEGKKTMRALAKGAGPGVEQSLYQFISKSPWDALPVRRELARLFQEVAQPRAWVVQPLVITKVGEHSVGVERQFVPELGRVVNCQQGMGIWLASDRMSAPVDWRLALPECWTEEPDARKRASIPEGVGACPPEKCATDSIARMAGEWGLKARPVVMDLRETDPAPVCAALMEHQIPFVLRIDPTAAHTPLELRRPRTDRVSEGEGLVTALSRHCMPVEWCDHTTGAVRATIVGATRVRLRRAQGRPDFQELMLLGAWSEPGARRPGEYWLSNLSGPRLGTVYRTAMLGRRVERDLAQVSDKVGIRDFEGRSFRGWHHHMTMVSLAHALTVMTEDGEAEPVPIDPRTTLAGPRTQQVDAA